MEKSDDRLLRDLEWMADRMKKQAEPNAAGVAMLGILSPTLASMVPATVEAGKRDLQIILRTIDRLNELLEGDGEHDG